MDPATEPSTPDSEAGQIRHGCCRRNPTRLDTDERVCRPTCLGSADPLAVCRPLSLELQNPAPGVCRTGSRV